MNFLVAEVCIVLFWTALAYADRVIPRHHTEGSEDDDQHGDQESAPCQTPSSSAQRDEGARRTVILRPLQLKGVHDTYFARIDDDVVALLPAVGVPAGPGAAVPRWSFLIWRDWKTAWPRVTEPDELIACRLRLDRASAVDALSEAYNRDRPPHSAVVFTFAGPSTKEPLPPTE